MTAPPPTPPRRRWAWRGLAAAVVLAAAGGGAWWHFRPRPPEPPAVDLAKADPEVARAVRAASDEVRAAPRDAAAWGRLGMLLLAHDFDTDSQAAFRAAADLDPADYRWPYLEGLTRVLYEPEAGLARLRRAAELAPPDRPEPSLRLAELLIERGDAVGALALVAGNTPAAVAGRVQLIRARAAAATGDWAAVLGHAAQAAPDPQCARAAALLRGQALAARGEAEKAEAEFRAAAALREPPAWADPAVREVESRRVGAAAQLARAGELIDASNAIEAVPLIEGVAARAPNSPEPHLLLGRALILAGNPRRAREVLDGHTVRFAGSVEGWFNLGVARFQTGDVDGAAAAFGRAVGLKPDHALAHFNLGHCHRKRGDRGAAKAAFEAALRCRPDHQPSRDALAELAAGK